MPILDVSILRIGALSVDALYLGTFLVSGGGAGPTNTVAPVISGDSAIGSVLTVTSTGTWSETPDSYAYQWYRDAIAISGSTSESYTLQEIDRGTSVRCAVTASAPSGASAPVLSNGVVAGSIPEWVPLNNIGEAPAYFDDIAGDRGYFDGNAYATEADLLTAVGGSIVSGQRIVGPYVSPSASELLVNGTFDADVSGWTGQNGGTPSWSSGELVLTTSGTANARAYRDVALTVGKAYRFQGTHRRGTSPSTHQIAVSDTGFGTTRASTPPATTGTVTDALTFGAVASTMYVAAVAPTGSAGTMIFDNLSVKEAAPLPGFANADHLWRIAGTIGPGAAVAEETLFSVDDGTDRNVIRLVRQTDGAIILRVRYHNTEQNGTSVGVIANGQAFVAWLAIKQNACTLLIEGGSLFTDTTSTIPGVAIMRTMGSIAGVSWTGSASSVAYWPASTVLSSDPNSTFDIIGDSMPITGASSANLSFYRAVPASYSPARGMTTDAVGGRDSSAMRTSALAHSVLLLSNVGIIFDCYNTGEDVPTYIQNIKDIAASRTGRFLVLSQPFKTDGSEASGSTFDSKTDIDAALSAFFPAANWLDIGSGTLTRADGLHLDDDGHALLSSRVKAKLDANGW